MTNLRRKNAASAHRAICALEVDLANATLFEFLATAAGTPVISAGLLSLAKHLYYASLLSLFGENVFHELFVLP